MGRRIFIAVNIPEYVKDEINRILSSKIDSDKCRIVKKENLHITMLFLGYFSDEAIAELKEKLNKINFGKFNVKLNGAGHFKGRVIWLGVGEGNEKLREVSEKLNEMLGIKDEMFHAHVTLARNKSLKYNEADALVEKLNNEKYESEIEVKSIDVMESHLTPNGPDYEKLFSIRMG